MRRLAVMVGVCGCAAVACAQHSENFETGYVAGMDLNGQNGYYNPVPSASVSAVVANYGSDPWGFVQNPTGGQFFVGGTGPAGGMFVRSQKDVPYPSGKVTMAFDIAAMFTGTLPAAQNLGSFSQQPSTTNANAIMLARWTDTNTAATWNADMVWYNAAGGALTEVVPDPGFQNLAINHWYRWSMTVDYGTNQVLNVSITDLHTGTSASFNPSDRYLLGGSAGGFPIPTGFRFFVGSSAVAGNTLAFDNLEIIPAPGALALLGLGGLVATRRRR